jgi:peptidoglycan/LPS O-acetylase OafA/YrhL
MAHANTHLSKNIRLDIQGLRALAVIADILYHINPVWPPGGYLVVTNAINAKISPL